MSNSISPDQNHHPDQNQTLLTPTPRRFWALRITTVRVICQIFFFALFCFLVLVNTFGSDWFQKRGWPVNFFFNIDPLIAISSSLSSHRLFAPLAWSLIILIPTFFLGRFFCSWICPFGSLHHFLGRAFRPQAAKDQIDSHRYRRFFALKYWLLIFLLVTALGNGLFIAVRRTRPHPLLIVLVAALLLAVAVFLLIKYRRQNQPTSRRFALGLALVGLPLYLLLLTVLSQDTSRLTSLQIGLLDPFCLLHRAINTAVLPLIYWSTEKLYSTLPIYQGSFLIGILFLTLLALNLVIPRFFCRVLCPLGALLGLCSRFAIFRIERHPVRCNGCRLCQKNCAGACDPHTRLRLSECIVCLNCLDDCPQNALSFSPPRMSPNPASYPSSPILVTPAVNRRQVVLAALAGAVTLPVTRLAGASLRNWNPKVIRPPASLPEEQFLQTCLKCGQCMRICPTNVLQPAHLEAGLEGLWTPILNNRIGRGCMPNCTACGNVCPTAAITPISIEQKRGLGRFAPDGPLRLGTAFVDRGRCLPWAMDQPCGVCEEVCPVSPKAIFLRYAESILPPGPLPVTHASASTITCSGPRWQPDLYATGDHFCQIDSGPGLGQRRPIKANSPDTLTLPDDQPFDPLPTTQSRVIILVRLPQPCVDPQLCIGCGICEHECPVSGLRAIRVTAENESRSKQRSLLLRS